MALRNLILIAGFIGSIPICFVRPFYGIALWVIVAFLNPQSYIWSVGQSIPWALVVAIPTIAGAVLFGSSWHQLADRRMCLVIALWIWFTVTSVLSSHTPAFIHHATDTWERWSFVSKILMMTLVTVSVVNSFERLRTLVLVIAGSFGFYVLKAFPFIVATGGSFRLYGPENSMIADNNDFGLALNMTLPLFFFLARAEDNVWARRFFALLFLITIPAVFFTYSRGALVGLTVVIGLMLLRLRQRFVLIPVIVLGAAVAVTFAPEHWQERMQLTDQSKVLDGSAQSRLNNWQFAFRLASDYPIAGGGFATFTGELYSRYSPKVTRVYGPHSIYFQVLGEHGFVGLALYLALLVLCIASMSRLIREAHRRDDYTVADYANMFRFSIVAFAVSGTFLGRAYFDYYFTIIACMTVLAAVALRKWAAEDEAGDTEEDNGSEIAYTDRILSNGTR